MIMTLKQFETMTLNEAFKLITAAYFFPQYCPKIINWRHKLRGSNGRGNPIEFTGQDKIMLKEGLIKFANEIKRVATYAAK
jgi:hypothetical protein